MKKRIFDNDLNLSRFVLMYRALDADPNIEIRLYDVADPQNITKVKHHYVEVESTLTDAQITAALANPQTQAEANAYALYVGARAELKAIPDWATYTQPQALARLATLIGTPIASARATIPTGNYTLAQVKPTINAIMTVLDGVYAVLQALVRIVIALRNKVF